ncbi:DUF499 domain-containing protein [Blautia schinkii]|nr:DUF499 domain-containing protein [Blautia schinkii]
MKTIREMLKPRESVFSDTVRDDVLNLSDFAEGRVNKEKFFVENFQTQGMTMLFDIAFKRFRGESDTGVVKLTQAMGGGKTHSMLALALLASDEVLRIRVLGKEYAGIGNIKVVTFSGRENADFGIWGSIAEQLDKKEMFSGYYSPLRAPGESAWINLLKGEKTLILFDELPPYLENAKSITVGNSDLSKVTMTALANLFSALGKEQLSNVCLVFSDLKAAYESGSELLQSSFRELEQEANRIAIEIAPVALNSDEIYSILRKRLFEDIGLKSDYGYEKNTIAMAYKDAVASAKKLGFTSYSGESVYKGIVDSYPFHPSIKELYARFKENQNFQQTRGLIKLMRQIVREIYKSSKADSTYLINVYDVNLNNSNLMAMFRQIKPSLEDAISHDIAQNNLSIAENIDIERTDGKDYAQQLAKMLLVSSLSTATHGILGLTEADALGYIAAPEVDISIMKTALEELKALCWYMKTDNRGRLYFQNTKNMVAEMNTLVDSYTNEKARKELKKMLAENFAPKLKVCYEQLFVLPAIDEIELDENKISLVIFEPYPGNRLHPDLEEFYKNSIYKNRVMFLSGDRSVMEKLYVNSKKLKAIQSILESMKSEGVSATDQQYKEAEIQYDKALQALLSTIRETFITLYYPTKNGIVSSDFKLEFKGNKFEGEEQIIAVLKEGMKYEPFSREDTFMETLRKKCEARLFTTKEMMYSQITSRAASETSWQWYHPDQLSSLREDCLKKDKWREIGGYLIKGPFEKDPTSVTVSQTGYDETKQEFTLRIHGVGGRVYYDIGADPTAASNEVEGTVFVTKEPSLRFVCIDPTGERKIGAVVEFFGKVPVKYGQRTTPSGRVMELATNSKYEVRYTTDGSEPKENGGIYNGEIVLPEECKFVRTATFYNGQLIDTKDILVDISAHTTVQKKIDESKTVLLRWNKMRKFEDTESAYREMETLSKINDLFLKGGSAYIYEKGNEDNYIEYTANIPYLPGDLQCIIDLIRETNFKNRESVVTFEYKEMMFIKGADFIDWANRTKIDLDRLRKEGDIIQ